MSQKPGWSPDRYVAAYRFAADAHRGQTVPGSGGLPYITHVSLVSMEVIAALQVEPFASPDLAVECALLHDTIEDTSVSHEDLAREFSTEVADGVQALSKDPSLPKAERMQDSLNRIREQPREVWIVKLADRITNLQPPPEPWSAEKRERYRNDAMSILDALGEVSPYLGARLQAKIAAYREYID